ncbi:hypothetical protein ILUMI_14473 [Ignelater luminosus]|uniref:Reverse transcriptase Ty1/copia-type domain-containing protein n=1 Tax=Ignelater luminosus TaxID=2038154 RepID=A0A8K0CYK9_IGNLU|nr:hypothetical protein ILUMI_14473 [Ignelater luminosus]
MSKKFKMTICEKPKTFLEMKIERKVDGTKLSQSVYANKALEKFHMKEANAVKIPTMSNNISNENEEEEFSYPFSEAVGSTLYLTNRTRPDLSYAINFNNRNMEKPRRVDIVNIKRCFRYLKGTVNSGIKYYVSDNDTMILNAYSDSEYKWVYCAILWWTNCVVFT